LVLGVNAANKLPDEDFERSWPRLIKMDESVGAKVARIPHL